MGLCEEDQKDPFSESVPRFDEDVRRSTSTPVTVSSGFERESGFYGSLSGVAVEKGAIRF